MTALKRTSAVDEMEWMVATREKDESGWRVTFHENEEAAKAEADELTAEAAEYKVMAFEVYVARTKWRGES